MRFSAKVVEVSKGWGLLRARSVVVDRVFFRLELSYTRLRWPTSADKCPPTEHRPPVLF